MCVSLFSAAAPAHAETHDRDVIVVYKNQNGKESAIDSGADVEQTYQHLPAVAVSADSQTVKDLKQDPDILYVEDNVSFQAAGGSDIRPLSVPKQQLRAAAMGYRTDSGQAGVERRLDGKR